MARHAETSRRHLLDRAVLRIAFRIRPREALGVFAAFAGVRFSADAVHRDGECFVRFARNRAVAHRARFEALENALDALDLLDRNRRAAFEIEQSAQRAPLLVLLVHLGRVLLERPVVPQPHRRLELVDSRGIKEMLLAVFAPLIITADVERVAHRRALRKCVRVPHRDFSRDLLQAHALDARRSPCEVFLHHRAAESHRLENLRAAIRLHGADAHLRRHFHHALDRRLREILARRLVVNAHEQTFLDHVVERLEREIRIHRADAVADEQRKVMHLTRLARFQHEADLRAGAFADEMVMQSARRQQ